MSDVLFILCPWKAEVEAEGMTICFSTRPHVVLHPRQCDAKLQYHDALLERRRRMYAMAMALSQEIPLGFCSNSNRLLISDIS